MAGYRLVNSDSLDEACSSMSDYINEEARTNSKLVVLGINPGGRAMLPIIQEKYLLKYGNSVKFHVLGEEEIDAQLNYLGIDSEGAVILVDSAINTGQRMQKVIDKLKKKYCKSEHMKFAVVYDGKGVRQQEINPDFWCIRSYDKHKDLEGCLKGSEIVLTEKSN